MAVKQKIENMALFSVVYPASEIYLNEFFDSLDRQTDKKFDIILANDGLTNLDIYMKPFSHLNIMEFPVHGTPAAIRLKGIEYIIASGYDYIIFGDSDDYFDHWRIEINRAYLQEKEIVFNDIHLVDKDSHVITENYLSHRFDNRQKLYKKDLVDKNFIGLTNSAVNTRILKMPDIKADVEAFDWYLFSVLHWQGSCSIFTNETVTCYRQHSNNFIGMKAPDIDAILSGVKVKLNHYRQMRRYDISYEHLYNQYDNLLKKLMASYSFESSYCHSIMNKKINYPLWWEQIDLMEASDES